MGEHKFNPMAQAHRSMPPAPTGGREAYSQIEQVVQPKPHILLVASDRMRTSPDGTTEILGKHRRVSATGEMVIDEEETWGPAPEGHRVHQLGTPLPPEDCDAVWYVMTILVDSTVIDSRGQAPATKFPVAEIARMGLLEWQHKHTAVKTGGLLNKPERD